MSPAPNQIHIVHPMSEAGSIICVPSKHSRLADVLEAESRRRAARLLSTSRVNTLQSQLISRHAHFFLLDFSERFASDFPPRSDFSDRSPLSLSFSFSFSARSIRSTRSDRSPPRSDLLSALLPSLRVPSSVDEVVGWGWPHLAISSCSEILAVMLFTQAFRSSCDRWRSSAGWDFTVYVFAICMIDKEKPGYFSYQEMSDCVIRVSVTAINVSPHLLHETKTHCHPSFCNERKGKDTFGGNQQCLQLNRPVDETVLGLWDGSGSGCHSCQIPKEKPKTRSTASPCVSNYNSVNVKYVHN